MPFSNLTFRHTWRPYQERVLRAVHDHLNDKRLHVVAAPGAGKTTLGLEIFRLLEKPTLVLSPTRIIRDQWIDRLRDFTPVQDPSNLVWVSNSSHDPKIFTSITYQALHVQFQEELAEDNVEGGFDEDESLNETELNSFIQMIENHKIGVLILDEAHHLRSEWWRALDKVCNHFPHLVLVSLTATPPYDSTGNEWMRYEELCGPIDEEISVPELVKAKTLCAHQDFIWASDATVDEKEQILDHDHRVSTFLKSLFTDTTFEDIVLSHPWLRSSDIEADIIKQPEVAISILSFLRAKTLPTNTALLELLDLREQDIPELGRKWWQVLVEAVLFSNHIDLDDDHKNFIDALKKQLKASELLIKKELCLVRSRRVERYLSLSSSKIRACVELHELEFDLRGDSLRQVILTDYIRDEGINSNLETGVLNLGAWPVYRALKMYSPVHEDIAMLTGRLSIIHVSKLDCLLETLDKEKLKVTPIQNTDQYVQVSGPTNQLTNSFTALLCAGQLKTLVGTKSLLGEGWDAPVVNSLILASSVGSFMLTNQMRGRAIRIDSQIPYKTSSIWHLVAINSESYSGWADYVNLKKRFDCFVGLSEKTQTIESGFERLNTKALEPEYREMGKGSLMVSENNRLMSSRLEHLTRMSDRWKKALILNESGRVIPSVQASRVPRLRSLIVSHSMSYLLVQLGMALFVAFYVYLQIIGRTQVERPLMVLFVVVAMALLYKLPKTIKVLKTLFKHLPVDGSLKQIGYALAEALCRAGFIDTAHRELRVNAYKSYDGQFVISLAGSTFYESSLFSDCMAEILAPIENPRYIILREGKFLGIQRDDYHAVPTKLGVKKEFADMFYKAWRKHVSMSQLIYTRTSKGRKFLLRAKMKAFSSNFTQEVKRQDRWQ